jgi:proteic killer suppression protein
VEVNFGDDDLERCYRQVKQATRRWGKKIARKYIQRINILYAVEAGPELGSFPELRFHRLKGDREGQWALRLDDSWRLIIAFDDRRMTVVRVEEVTDHYGN